MQAVLLYLDPKGNDIFTQSHTGSVVDHIQVKGLETTTAVPVLKAKIKELQAQLQALEV